MIDPLNNAIFRELITLKYIYSYLKNIRQCIALTKLTVILNILFIVYLKSSIVGTILFNVLLNDFFLLN